MESSDAMADTPSTPVSTSATPDSTPASTPPSTPATPSSPASTPIPTDSTSADPKIPPTPDATPPPIPKTTRDTPSTPYTPKSSPAQHTPDQASIPGSPRSLTPASVSGTGTPIPASPTPHSPSPQSPTPESPTPRPPTPRSPGVAASPPSHLPVAATHSFKSSLKILLKKQDDQLDINREYKKSEEAKEEEEKKKSEENGEKKEKPNKKEDRQEPKKEEKERSKKGRATKEEKKRENKDEQHYKKKDTNRKEIEVVKDDKQEVEERSGKGEESTKRDKRKKSLANEIKHEEEEKQGKTPKGGTSEKAKEREGDQKKSEETEEAKKEISIPEGKKDRSEDKRKLDKDRRSEAKAQEKQSEDKTKERSKRKEREKEDGEVEAKKSKPEDKGTTEEERGKNTEKSTIKEGKSMRWRDEEEVTKGEKTQGVLYIMKGEKPFSRWKRYYFVLDGKLLTYYRSVQDYQNQSGVKGSLDLALLEQVAEKRPGLLRSNFPFKISRRSLPSVSLAAETKEDRERWMEVIYELLQRLLRLTDHTTSEPTRRATHANTNKTEQNKTKYSTLPNPKKSPSSPSICNSEDEDEEEKEKEEEGKKEEEPKLIMPKKIPRVPMGLPMGVPVGSLKLDGFKLKKVELPIKKENPKKEGENEKQNASEKDKADRVEEEGNENMKSSAEEMFGIKLKRISPEKKLENDDDKAEEAAGEGIKERSDGKKESKEDFTSVNLKRPTKQPVIPLNTTGLLARPELQSTKVSPGSQKRSTTERRISPSPTIPISKSVQALTKSAEDAKATNKDTFSDATSTENVSNLNGKINTTAQTIEIKEIKYPDIVNLDDDQETVAPLKDEDEAVLGNVKNSKEIKKAREQEEEVAEKTTLPIPEVSVILRSNSKEETQSEKCSSEKEIYDTGTNEAKTSDTPPFPALSSSMERTNASSSAMKCNSNSQDNEEVDDNTTQSTTAVSIKKQNSQLPPDSSPTRRRSNTNDSSCSSQLGDTDGTERKQGKFKLFKIKRSSSSASKEKKEDGEGKELKDKKRRSSNAFSKFLPGKKSKDKIGKPNEEETEVQSEENVEENSESQDQRRLTQVPAIEVSMATILAVSEERTDEAREEERQDQLISQTSKELSKVNKEPLTSTSTEDLVMRRERSQSREALRGSNYSSSSREQEPAPCLPEKTGIRAKSPIHDIPQCNQPVTYVYDTNGIQTTEDETRPPVDGYISEKQILDILSDREKRRMSQGLLQRPMLSVPDRGGAVGMGQTWAEDFSSKRPSYISLTSMESDDPLPTTNFLGCERNSSSSGSLKARESDSSGCEEPEPPTVTPPRKSSRPTDSLTVGKRVSLTLPEFTVVEEDGLASPDTAKTRLPNDSNVESEKKSKEEEEPNGKQQQEHKGKQDIVEESQEKTIDEKEKDEQGDYFPVVGRGDGEGGGEVELRLLHTSQEPPMRTSGITSLQQYLKEEEGEAGEVRSGISRLGHSAAVEKLKQTAGDL